MEQKRGGKRMILGVFLVVLGLSYLFSAVFHINLPVFRVTLGVFVIYLGLKILFGSNMCSWRGGSHFRGDDAVVFDKGNFAPKSSAELKPAYNVIFGQGEVDLTGLDVSAMERELELNAIFGELRAIVPHDAALELRSSAVAGSIEQPREAPAQAKTRLRLKANAIFGSIKIERR